MRSGIIFRSPFRVNEKTILDRGEWSFDVHPNPETERKTEFDRFLDEIDRPENKNSPMQRCIVHCSQETMCYRARNNISNNIIN